MHRKPLKKPLLRVDGILIKAIDYGESDKILHIFTRDLGILPLIAKRASDPKNHLIPPISPLSKGQFLYTDPDKSLPKCKEISITHPRLELRQSFELLNDACQMGLALNKALLPGKPAPNLFDLFDYFLNHMTLRNSKKILTSFYLKLLRHEGVFTLPAICSKCNQNESILYFDQGSFFCKAHAPHRTLAFSNEELKLLKNILYSKSLLEITSFPLTKELTEKCKKLFEEGKTVL